MDLWQALGVSREAGLLGAGLGLLTALVLAAGMAIRRRAERPGGPLGLDDR
jgi:ABC-type nitrate/sulfonate/bicarbonate transport system permease component